MAVIKFRNVFTNRYEVEGGTCELCMGTGIAEEVTFLAETSDGEVGEVDAFEWSWGTWGSLIEIYISNIPMFMKWFNEQAFEVNSLSEVTYSWLDKRVDEWNLTNIHGANTP